MRVLSKEKENSNPSTISIGPKEGGKTNKESMNYIIPRSKYLTSSSETKSKNVRCYYKGKKMFYAEET